ncbi:Nuclease S1-like protein 1 [Phlyctema vagabunda]|uniref:Nuclease S1-like protein 1 n=1 Tax=Phlyctema vagabunda TaxID=108571 RepID=A0ABR4PSM6_9HELO
MKTFIATAGVLAMAPRALAWGTLGHDTVAYIATNFVSAQTKTYFQGVLGSTSTDYLASVATWADSYRYTAAGTFSAGYHYIDAQDSPPTSCSVDFARDCPAEGCVVSAISNYTSRIQSTKISAAEKLIAAKFLVHFIGDIHQPLHDENLEVGGNSIAVTFDGVATNLHHIWDTNIPEKLVGGYSLADAKTWAANLTKAINTGTYSSKKASWTKGIDITNPQASALVWAKDANSYVCTTVLPKGVDGVESVDLGGAYYNTAIPVVTELVAKAGYRLAAWLDLIATGKTAL